MKRRWPAHARLLVIRLDASGDLLMCTPALHALAQAGFTLSLLTSSAGALVGTRSSAVRQVICFDPPWMKASAATSARASVAIAQQLREQAFDGAVIMHSYSQSPLPAAMLCHLAEIPRQLAYCRENPYQLISDWLPETEPDSLTRHEVQRQLDLVGALTKDAEDARSEVRHGERHSGPHGGPRENPLRLTVTADERQAAEDALVRLGLGREQPFLLLHPGATAASRRYPLEYLQVVAAELPRVTRLPLVLAGGELEQPALHRLHQCAGKACAGIVQPLGFGALAALIGKARLLIANNSAPAHLAAAMQTPVVVPYALTNPQHTPWQVPSRVLFNPVPCAPCYCSRCPQAHHACMEGILPAQLIRAVIDLLGETEAHTH